jgi:transposase, IS5 family
LFRAPGCAAVKRVASRLMCAQEHVECVVQQVHQVNEGHLKIPDRLVSIFDLDARPIQRAELDRSIEFSYKVRLTESAEHMITEYRVFQGNPPNSALLVGGVTEHYHRVGRIPTRAATDRGFLSLETSRRSRNRVC